MAKCEECLHRKVCEKRTCSECSGGFGCDDCEIYHTYDGKPSIENCEHFRADEAEVKHGVWRRLASSHEYICSNCERVAVRIMPIGTVPTKCPSCGAKMTIGGDE